MNEAEKLGFIQSTCAQETLVKLAPPFREDLQLGPAFNALDYDLEAKFSGHADHCLHDDPVAATTDYVGDHRSVDFDRIYWQSRQIGQAGIARTEVVDGDAHSRISQRIQTPGDRWSVCEKTALYDFGGDTAGIDSCRGDLRKQPVLIARTVQIGRQEIYG